MGWKSCYFIAAENDCPYGYLGTLPTHNPDRATEIFKKLGYSTTNRRESSICDYPEMTEVNVGAYPQAVIVSDQAVYDCFEDRNHPLLKNALTLIPNGTLLLVVLHSTVNYFGYAFYENGVLKREYAGGADQGVTHEFGELLEEERDHFEKSKLVDGQRLFVSELNGKLEEWEPDLYGETLVFAVLNRYYGEIVDAPVSGHGWPDALQGEAIDKPFDYAAVDGLYEQLKGPEKKKSEGSWWQRLFK